jgi:predicted NBD/HSP70 family sugar kinase
MIGAIDIGGTKIAVGMVDDRGRVRSKMEIPTGRDSSYPTSLRQIGKMLRKAAQEAGVKITGIGIGSTRCYANCILIPSIPGAIIPSASKEPVSVARS